MQKQVQVKFNMRTNTLLSQLGMLFSGNVLHGTDMQFIYLLWMFLYL